MCSVVFTCITRLKQRSAKADEAEAKYDVLNTELSELQAQYVVRIPDLISLYAMD